MIAIKRIFLSRSLSDTSDAAMKYAMALARTFGAKLHLGRLSRNDRTDIAAECPFGIDPTEEAVREQCPRILAPADRWDLTMPRRQSALEDLADELSASGGANLLDLEPLTTLLVRTCHTVYRIIVLRGTTVLVQGGPSFPDATTGQLNGSGFGGNLLKLGWIGVGLRMEISWDGKRFVTSPVRAITIESNPSTDRPQ